MRLAGLTANRDQSSFMGMETTVVRVPDHVLYRFVPEGGAVLLDLERREYFALDDVAARMWEVLADTGVVADIAEALVLEYDVRRSILLDDADRFVRTLVEQNLIHRVDI